MKEVQLINMYLIVWPYINKICNVTIYCDAVRRFIPFSFKG